MKLSELFLAESEALDWPKTYGEVLARVNEWLDFTVGTELPGKRNSRFKINENLTVSLNTYAAFGDNTGGAASVNGLTGKMMKKVYTRNRTLPFKMKRINGSMTIDGFKKLDTLEGCPYEVYGDFEVTACPQLVDMQHAPDIIRNDVRIRNCKNLKSLNGLPVKVNGLRIAYTPALNTFEGFPSHIAGDLLLQEKSMRSLIGIADHVKYISGYFSCFKNDIKEGGLGLIMIDGLSGIDLSNPGMGNSAFSIIAKYIGMPDKIFECQQELIEAGYEAFAQL